MNFSKIVYSLVTPETEFVVNSVLGKPPHTSFHSLYREAWTQKQDAYHEALFNTWLSWIKPYVSIDTSQFLNMYPTNGASEAIREVIASFGNKSRVDGKKPFVHIFEGEYEGFAAYAESYSIPVIIHARKNIPLVKAVLSTLIEENNTQHLLLVSQPNAFDGNFWTSLDEILHHISFYDNIETLLDLTYVGCVTNLSTINTTHSTIKTIVFSLSKPAGAYYHRVGGILSKHPIPGLYGNKWFKNIMGIMVGLKFISTYSVLELPTKYKDIQNQALQKAQDFFQCSLHPSSVYILALFDESQSNTNTVEFLRGGNYSPHIGYSDCDSLKLGRICLSPNMAYLIDPSLNPSVTQRNV